MCLCKIDAGVAFAFACRNINPLVYECNYKDIDKVEHNLDTDFTGHTVFALLWRSTINATFLFFPKNLSIYELQRVQPVFSFIFFTSLIKLLQ